MHLRNLHKIELDLILDFISETDMRTMINEDVSNRKSYMVFFKKSKLDKIPREEIVQYIYKFVYEQEVNKNLLKAIIGKIVDKVLEVDTEGVLDKALLLVNEAEKNELSDEQINQLNQYKASFHDLGFVLGFDACARLADKKILIVPETPDINLEKVSSSELEMMTNTILENASELQRLRKERESLVSKIELLNYKNAAQQEIKDLKKEVKNLKKELQLCNKRLDDEQKKSFVKKHLTLLPNQIKKIVSDLVISDDDSLKIIWKKVSEKETELISRIPKTVTEKRQFSESLSSLLAFKYIIIKLNESEDNS
jgi:hypothetical protein